MKLQQLKKLNMPDAPGVYTFRDSRKRPIYIGRATSLKDRVKSYFSNDLVETRGMRIVEMVIKAKYLTWQETDSVLEAVILESTLIKRYQPYFNIDERDDKSSQYVIITDELWPRVFLVRVRDYERSDLFERGLNKRSDLLNPEAKQRSDLYTPHKVLRRFGPYNESGLIKEALKILRKMFPFRDKKAIEPRHEAFYRALGKSPETESSGARENYLRTIKYLIMFFEGKKKQLRKDIEKDMNSAAREMDFERANRSKRLLFALDHVNDIALISRGQTSRIGTKTRGLTSRSISRNHRIEAYDVAHLSGTNVVGSMTVISNGEWQPAEYRKFKLTREANNDAVALAEILYRRLNHSEWAYPDIIVVDGNQIQISAAENVLKARRINIPVIGVTKDEHHKAAKLVGSSDLIKLYSGDIIKVNSEAHRFAIAYHRKLRKIPR